MQQQSLDSTLLKSLFLTSKQRLIVGLIAINIVIYVFWLYLPVLSGGYIWDDLSILRDALSHTFEKALHPAVFQGSNFYRPVGYLAFVVEAKLFGVNPLVSHGINLMLLAVSMGMMYVLSVVYLSGKLSVALRCTVPLGLVVMLVSLPLMAESVAWVAARFELLSLFFLLVGVAYYGFGPGILSRDVVLGVLFLLALLSKESVAPFLVAFPLVIALRERVWEQSVVSIVTDSRFLRPFCALAASFGIYVILRVIRFDGAFVPVSVFDYYSPMEHLRLIIQSFAQYADILLQPWKAPPPFYIFRTDEEITAGWWLGLVIGLASILFLFLAAIKTKQKRFMLPLLFLLWLLPVINLFPIFPGLFSVAPRYLILPVTMVAVTLLLWLPAVLSRMSAIAFLLFSLCVIVISIPASRAFVSQFETDDHFWDVLIDRYGIYHPVVAMNGIKSKVATFNYDVAHHRLLVSRKSVELSESFVDHQITLLAYARGLTDVESKAIVSRKINEWLSGTSLLALDRSMARLELARWLNMKALFAIQACELMDLSYESAIDAQQIENDVTARLVAASATSPLLFLLAGYPLDKFDSPFKQEQARELVRLLQRDLKRCGVGFSGYDGL